MAIIKREARPVALEELVEVVERGRADDPVVAMTFDDAYADVIENAAPALTAAGVPATLFVPTDPVAHRRAFWWDELEACLRLAPPDAPPVLQLTVGGERRAWVVRTADQRRQARRHLHAWLQAQPPEVIERALEDLGAWAGHRPQVQPPAAIEQLARFAEQPGLELGGHTVRHIRLRGADPRLQRAEIDEGLDAIGDWTGRRPRSFAYPFGVPGVDFDAASERIVAACGCAHAVALAPAPLTRRSDRYALPRHVVPDAGGDAFAAWLHGVLR